MTSDRTLRICLLVFALAATGCGVFKKTRECNRLALQVNQELDHIEERAKAKTPAAYRGVAASYQRLAKQLRSQPLATPAGVQLTEEYAAFFEAVSPPLELHAQALEGKDPNRIAETKRGLEHVTRQQKNLQNRFELFCRPR